jgi:flagellar export protein FliJ
MKKFVWRLQRVLDLKVREERLMRSQLMELTEKLVVARGELLMQERILENLMADVADSEPVRRIREQEFFSRCSQTNIELIKTIKVKIKELEQQRKEKITDLLRVRRFKELLEKLRTRAMEEFNRQMEKLEQKEQDERSSVMFVRKQRSKVTV